MFDKLIEHIRAIYKADDIPLHAPVLGDLEKKLVLGAIESGYVSTAGAHVGQFEKQLSDYTGAVASVAVVNGTSALHAALLALGVRSNDYVLTQALTFVATANAISYTGAEPIFLDSDKSTFGLCPESLKSFLLDKVTLKNGEAILKENGRRISACVPMHVFGNPMLIEEVVSICHEYGIKVIEDAAEALGSFVGRTHVGLKGDIGVLSFNGNKIITTGGGGALLFKDEKLSLKVRHLVTTAKKSHSWRFIHDEIGYNYRMPNLNAALGCAQLQRMEEFLEAKKKVAESYSSFFENFEDAHFVEPRPGTTSNYWLNAVLLKDQPTRDEFLEYANGLRVGARAVWDLMVDLPMYQHCLSTDLTVSRDISARLVNLPSGVPL